MEIITTTILITIGIVLIAIGHTFNKIKNFLFLPIAGGVLIMILGITAFIEPITYKTGETQIQEAVNPSDNATTTYITYDYNEVSSTSNNILAWVLTLVGLITIIVSTIMIYDRRFEEEKTYDW